MTKEVLSVELFYDLFANVLNFTWQEGVMVAIGCILAWSGAVFGITLYNTIWIIMVAYVARYLSYTLKSCSASLHKRFNVAVTPRLRGFCNNLIRVSLRAISCKISHEWSAEPSSQANNTKSRKLCRCSEATAVATKQPALCTGIKTAISGILRHSFSDAS